MTVVGQYFRDLDGHSVGELSTLIFEEVSSSAKMNRNQGLAHNIFAHDPTTFYQNIKRNLLLAKKHFTAILTICDQKHANGPTSVEMMFRLAEAYYRLGLYFKTIEYLKKIIEIETKDVVHENFELEIMLAGQYICLGKFIESRDILHPL